MSFSAENRRVTYRDDAGTQEDFTRTDLRSGLRLSPNRTTDITFGLSYGLFDGDRSAARETWGFDAGVALERPLGRSTVSLDVRQTEDQTRSNLSFGHSFETKRGTQGVRLGFARVDNGDLSMIGGLDLSYELPRGNLTGSLDRRLSVSDDDDSETLQTRARLGYVHALTPLDTLSFDVSYAQNREIGSGDEITNTEIGATWSRELSPDWSLDLGLRHRQRQQDTGPDGRSNSAFIELRRGLSLRF